MIVMASGRSLTEPVELLEPERFDDLHVEQPRNALIPAGLPLEAHKDRLRRRRRPGRPASGLARLSAMIGYATSKGWADDPARTVTAHVELI
ncbi:hypothetical protein [Herbiconiux ginsengi]|uniref:Uncharacterized protein n=1 Tax=Herbiconiux ginsengi TaxID=381665 RepID=A0A1H3THD3_9MICO|nr:hypothetical protein [Herbiconiux ginsengi]SDZ48739.1 hypothetical protein SAMN05216554_4155 [Herbiconiux ginsengi]